MIARLLISSLPKRVEEIEKILLEIGMKNPHPDLLYFETNSKLGIEQAKKIKDHFAYKPNQAKGKVVVIESTDNMTPEAQNALLKTIEELPENGLFILGANSEANFLPTILSRCQIIHISNPTSHRTPTSEVGYEKDIEELLKTTIPERFEYIEKLKDREEFLQALVSYFHQTLSTPGGWIRQAPKDHLDFIKELLEAEKWAKQNVNIRGILEYLMLVMPLKK